MTNNDIIVLDKIQQIIQKCTNDPQAYLRYFMIKETTFFNYISFLFLFIISYLFY
jgi:hypothetical protein